MVSLFRPLRVVGLAVALGSAALPARAKDEAAAPPARPAPAVSVVEAVRREIVETVAVTGTLVPRDEILVSPEVDGFRVTAVLAEEGMRVERGQVLARLSRDLVERQLAQQAALVEKAEAAVPQAESSIAQAVAARTEASLSFERARQLQQSGNATAVVIEGRTSALAQAESRLLFARNGLLIARAELAQALAVRAELELKLARTEIRAPEAGIVSRRTARVGSTASASAEPLFRLIARGEIELEGEVIETKLPALREGSPAFIDLAGGERVPGRVRAVYPEVDRATRLGKVRISLAADPRLRIGTFARGAVELARADAVTVPQAAILYGDQGAGVLVVKGGTVETRIVRTGLGDDDDIAVRDGLQPGERVVARAGSFLRNGDRVRPVPVPAPGAPVTATRQNTAEAGTP